MANTTQAAAETAEQVAEGLASTAGHAAEAAGHAAQSAGMPQLDFSTFPNQIFWLVVALVLIFIVLKAIALPRIGATIANREGTISGDLALAEQLKAKAVEAERAYNQALADARSEAQKIAAATKAEIAADLAKATAAADAEISARAAESEKRIGEIRAGALESVAIVAKDAAAEIVAALGGKADAEAVATAVAARLKG